MGTRWQASPPRPPAPRLAFSVSHCNLFGSPEGLRVEKDQKEPWSRGAGMRGLELSGAGNNL